MRKLLSTLVLVLFVAGPNQSKAGHFVHNFGMNDDYTQYLLSTLNAKVWDERPDGLPVRYWGASATGVFGIVIYKYAFSTPIVSADLYANLLGTRPGDQTFLDVSPDGVSYTTVASGYVHPQSTPPYSLPLYDLTPTLSGSKTAFVRARLLGSQLNSDIFSAQFLRTADDVPFFQAPYVYQFRADTANIVAVPEPTSLSAGIMAGIALIVDGWRRHKAKSR